MDIPSAHVRALYLELGFRRGPPPKMTTRVADNGGSIIFEDVNDNEGIRRLNNLEKAGEFGPDALHTSEDYTADLNRMFKDVNRKSFSDLWQEDPKQAITALENFLSAEKILIENLGDIYDGTKRIHLEEGLLADAERAEDEETTHLRRWRLRERTDAIEAKKQAIYEAGWPYKIDKIIVDDGEIVGGAETANTQNAYKASIEWNKSLRRKRPKSAAKVPGKKKTAKKVPASTPAIAAPPNADHKIKGGGRRRKTARKYKRKKRKSYRKRKTRRRTRKKTRRRRRRK